MKKIKIMDTNDWRNIQRIVKQALITSEGYNLTDAIFKVADRLGNIMEAIDELSDEITLLRQSTEHKNGGSDAEKD
jgi:hypothetical protein